MIFSFGVYDSTYSVAHWMFAAHYYTNAMRIELIYTKKSLDSNQLYMNILFWSLIAANALLPLIEEGNLFKPQQSVWKLVGVGFTCLL